MSMSTTHSAGASVGREAGLWFTAQPRGDWEVGTLYIHSRAAWQHLLTQIPSWEPHPCSSFSGKAAYCPATDPVPPWRLWEHSWDVLRHWDPITMMACLCPVPSPPGRKEQIIQRWPVPRAQWTPADRAKSFHVLTKLPFCVKAHLTRGWQLWLVSLSTIEELPASSSLIDVAMTSGLPSLPTVSLAGVWVCVHACSFLWKKVDLSD